MKLDITIHYGEDSDYRLKREDVVATHHSGNNQHTIIVHSSQAVNHVAVLVGHEIKGIITKETLS